jgi:hypothetical protein
MHGLLHTLEQVSPFTASIVIVALLAGIAIGVAGAAIF